MKTLSALLLSFTLSFSLPVLAQVAKKDEKPTEAASESVLSKVTLGPHISGPELKAADLEGKVVAIVEWGMR